MCSRAAESESFVDREFVGLPVLENASVRFGIDASVVYHRVSVDDHVIVSVEFDEIVAVDVDRRRHQSGSTGSRPAATVRPVVCSCLLSDSGGRET